MSKTKNKQINMTIGNVFGYECYFNIESKYDLRDYLNKYLSVKYQPNPSQIIKENKSRKIFSDVTPGGIKLFVKEFKKPSFFNSFGHNRAMNEMNNTRHLARNNVNTPNILAGINYEKKSGVLFYEFMNFISLSEYLKANKHNAHQLIKNAARLVFNIHKAKFHHLDMHAGNILINTDNMELYIADVHRGKITNITHKDRVANVAHVIYSLFRVSSPSQRICFIKEYLKYYSELVPYSEAKLFYDEINQQTKYIAIKHIKSRRGRPLSNNSYFELIHTNKYKICFNKNLIKSNNVSELESIITNNQYPDYNVLQKKNNSSVHTFKFNNKNYLCKTLLVNDFKHILKNLFFYSRAQKEWVNSFLLGLYNIKTPNQYALFIEKSLFKHYSSYIIYDFMDNAYTLTEFIQDNKFNNDLTYNLALRLAEMHRRGIYHCDLKANNILIAKVNDKYKINFIDIDRIKYFYKLPLKLRLYNLAQLNASIPQVSEKERIRFLRIYLRLSNINPVNQRKYIKIIYKYTVKRKHVWPNAQS